MLEQINEYINYKESHIDPKSLKAYKFHILRLQEIGKPLTEITNADIANQQIKLLNIYKTATIELYTNAIKGFFKYWSRRLDLKVYYEEIKRPKTVEVPCTYLNEHDMNQMEKIFNPEEFWSLRILVCIRLLRDTGARVSEICSMPLESIENGYARIVSKKSKRIKVLSWSDETDKLLKKYLGVKICLSEDPWVFSEDGNPINTRSVQRWVKFAGMIAGIHRRVYPHLYRHTKAFEMVRSKGGLFAAQQKLGHVNIQSTLKYLRLDIEKHLEIVGEKGLVHSNIMADLQALTQTGYTANKILKSH